MNKKLIAMAVAGVMAAPLAANAADVSGFAAIDLMLSTDNPACDITVGANTYQACETQFGVDQTEVDFESNGVRVDINDNGSGLEVEQANFTTGLGSSGWNLTGGLFNSGLTADHQDRNMMAFDTHSLVYQNYDNVDLTNVAGVGVSGMAGPADVMVAIVNDPTIDSTGSTGTTADDNDAGNAYVLKASGSVMDGLDVALSYVSADAYDLTDLIIGYSMNAFMVGLDYATNDSNDAYSITGGYDFGNGMDVKVRIDNNNNKDGASDFKTDTTTVAFGYKMSDNVTLHLENYDYTDDTTGGTADYNQTTLSFIANF